jgi:SPX domain protein involved in polyphosphate accumulation
MHPAGFRELFPKRQVNNVYFDTPGFSTYKANVAGLAERKKFRVRWYGKETLNIENAVLEIKLRDNEVGDKLIFPLDPFSFLDLRPLIRQVNLLGNEITKSLRPTLYNSYNRFYFISPDQEFRITLDNELRYAPMLPEAFINRYPFSEDQISIMELKYDESKDSAADRITQFIPYRRTKNSKYVSGIDLCYR